LVYNIIDTNTVITRHYIFKCQKPEREIAQQEILTICHTYKLFHIYIKGKFCNINIIDDEDFQDEGHVDFPRSCNSFSEG